MKTAIFVLRGMLGASIGGIVWMFLPAVFMGVLKDPSGLELLIFWYLALVLWMLAALGGIIAFVIWVIHWSTGAELPVFIRMSIATAVALIPMALLLFRTEKPLTLFNLWYPIFFGITVGGLAGLFVGSPKRLAGDRTAVEQIVGRERRERVS